MQAVASYISRRFFVGNCRKFVVSLSYCQRKTFIFKALRRFLSTCRPYYRWRSCLLNWPVCKTVLIWALSGLCPDSALWLWAIIERIRIACQKAYLLTDWTEHEKHAPKSAPKHRRSLLGRVIFIWYVLGHRGRWDPSTTALSWWPLICSPTDHSSAPTDR